MGEVHAGEKRGERFGALLERHVAQVEGEIVKHGPDLAARITFSILRIEDECLAGLRGGSGEDPGLGYGVWGLTVKVASSPKTG
jgi:hypothetical protein